MKPMDAFSPSEPTQDTSTCSSESSDFRVRGVSEINDAEEPVVASSGMKRKNCTGDFLNENEAGVVKKSKNISSNNEDATSSNGPCKDSEQDHEKNQESVTEQNSPSSNRVLNLNGSDLIETSNVEDMPLSSVPEIVTQEENAEEARNDNNPASSSATTADGGKGDAHESNNDDDPCSSSTGILVKVKEEPLDTHNSKVDVGTSTSNNVDIKPTLNVKKEEATSTSRESCKYGIRCYRRNPMHRIEEAHPGDHDYKRPNFPLPPAGTPDCPFGDACYRRNPTHFQQFTHPPETDFEQNWKNKIRLRQRRQQTQNNLSSNNDDFSDHSSDYDDYDMEDPFIDDEDQDYVPSDNDDDDEEYDECDKAEE